MDLTGECFMRRPCHLAGGILGFLGRHKRAVIAAAVAAGAFKIWTVMKVRRMRLKWDTAGLDVVVLHTAQPCKTVPCPTPFAVKLETFFRMMNIKYEYDYKMPMGPKNKVPWITFNGVDYTDSELIVQMLQTRFARFPDANVPEQELAVGQAMKIMVEEHLYWGLVSWRYVEDDMKSLRRTVDVPYMMILLFKWSIRGLRETLYMQGLGRHSIEELHVLMKADLEALSHYLGPKDFLYGSEPHVADCAIFGMLVQIMYTMPGSPYLKWMTDDFTNLAAYTERVKLRFWQDWDQRIKQPGLVL